MPSPAVSIRAVSARTTSIATSTTPTSARRFATSARFYRKPKSSEGYVLPREVLLEKVRETVELGGDQILMQGGLHPDYKLEWYEELLHDIRSNFPQINIHGFSPPEIHHFTKVNKLPLRTVLERLKAAGLGSLPWRRR
jgi:cyclic dehypoxanthinyl futalosine synthase